MTVEAVRVSQAGPGEDGIDALLRRLRRQTSGGSGLELRDALEWLHQRTGSAVAVVDAVGAVEAATRGFPAEILEPLRPVLGKLSDGRMGAAAARVGATHVQLEALGSPEVRPVLVTAGVSAPTKEAAGLVSQAAAVIALLRRAGEADEVADRYRRKTRQLRFAVHMALMAGDPGLARRMTADAVPALLNAEQVRVHLLHCPPGDRDRISWAYQDASGFHGPDLLVRCPVYNTHLICLIAEKGGASGSHGSVLRRLVRENSHYALGISSPHPLNATAGAYAQACHALAVADKAPGRVASYRGRAPLADILPSEAALDWARAFLLPLGSAPKLTLDVTRYAVTVHRSGVARLLGISRNTVTTHIRHAEQALGVGLDDVSSRAALDLALSLAGPFAGYPTGTLTGSPETPPTGIDDRDTRGRIRPEPTLDELLHGRRALGWAEAFLSPLHGPGHSYLDTTLRAWIAANTNAQQTAQRLGISRNTVRSHLRVAERLLSRDLLSTGSGVHDLVHALSITQGRRPLIAL
jgi:DNA-binding CsgD family transcriptional regulator